MHFNELMHFTSVNFYLNKPHGVLWVITLTNPTVYLNVYSWPRPHVWRHPPPFSPPPQPLSLHLTAYTALLIGELLSFLCLDSRKALLPRSTSPAQKNRKNVLGWCHNSAGVVREPFPPMTIYGRWKWARWHNFKRQPLAVTVILF